MLYVYMICHIILTVIGVAVVSIEMIEISALVAKNIRKYKPYIRHLLLLGTGLILCLLKGKSAVFGLAFVLFASTSFVLWCLVAAKRIIHDTSKNDTLS